VTNSSYSFPSSAFAGGRLRVTVIGTMDIDSLDEAHILKPVKGEMLLLSRSE
jgi:hypothetical protein